MSTATELRDLAKQIEQACLASPVSGPAMPIVRNAVDHLLCVARLHELHAMRELHDRPGYGD